MDDSRVPASDVDVCPHCHAVAVAFDFQSGSQVCHQCGWEADADFETLGRVIGGGPESGRVEIKGDQGAVGQDGTGAALASAASGSKPFLRGARDGAAVYRMAKAREAESEVEKLCTAIHYPDVSVRAKGILTEAKRRFSFQWGKWTYPYVIASIITAARETKRGVHIADFLPFIPADVTAKSIFRALLKVGAISRDREPAVYVQRIFNHLASYVKKPSSIPHTFPHRKMRDERNLDVLRALDMRKAQAMTERLTRRFDPHGSDPATLAVAAALIVIEQHTLGTKNKIAVRNREALAADMIDGFMGALNLKTSLDAARGILAWVEKTWKSLSKERGWTLNTTLVEGNSAKDVVCQRHWKRNVALLALRHVDLLPLPDPGLGNEESGRAKLIDFIKPREEHRQKDKMRKIEVASGKTAVTDEDRHLLHDPDVIHYRRMILEGKTAQDIIQDSSSTLAPPSNGSLAAYAADRGLTVAELVNSEIQIPDELLFQEGEVVFNDAT